MNDTDRPDATRTDAPPSAAPAAPMVALDHVTLDRPSGATVVRALDQVSLAVAPGEMVVMMGPSGSGKTSVIDVAAGLAAPSHGQVWFDGVASNPADRDAWRARRRRSIGVVHQRLDLMPGLSVLDNVALPLLLEHVSVRRAHERARTALGRVGLDGADDRPPADLSGGERQRVAIARAVVGDRRLLLADEPTAAVDSVTAEAIVELLARLAGEGTAVLMATHDSRLTGWADRVVFLRDGRVVPDRAPTPTLLPTTTEDLR